MFAFESEPENQICILWLILFLRKRLNNLFIESFSLSFVCNFNHSCSFFAFELDSVMERNTSFPVFPSNHSSNSSCSRDNAFKMVVLPVLYSCLFLTGISLNCLAAWVLFHIPSRSHFIIYLKNIVVADIIMTLTFPFKVSYNIFVCCNVLWL